MRNLRCWIVAGLVCSAVPASAETAPGTLTVSVVVIDRCVVSNARATSDVVKCSAAAPPHRVMNEVRPIADAVGGVGRTIIF